MEMPLYNKGLFCQFVSIHHINLHTQNVQFWSRFDEKLAEKAHSIHQYVSILRTIFRQIWTKSGRSHLHGEWLRQLK